LLTALNTSASTDSVRLALYVQIGTAIHDFLLELASARHFSGSFERSARKLTNSDPILNLLFHNSTGNDTAQPTNSLPTTDSGIMQLFQRNYSNCVCAENICPHCSERAQAARQQALLIESWMYLNPVLPSAAVSSSLSGQSQEMQHCVGMICAAVSHMISSMSHVGPGSGCCLPPTGALLFRLTHIVCNVASSETTTRSGPLAKRLVALLTHRTAVDESRDKVGMLALTDIPLPLHASVLPWIFECLPSVSLLHMVDTWLRQRKRHCVSQNHVSTAFKNLDGRHEPSTEALEHSALERASALESWLLQSNAASRFALQLLASSAGDDAKELQLLQFLLDCATTNPSAVDIIAIHGVRQLLRILKYVGSENTAVKIVVLQIINRSLASGTSDGTTLAHFGEHTVPITSAVAEVLSEAVNAAAVRDNELSAIAQDLDMVSLCAQCLVLLLAQSSSRVAYQNASSGTHTARAVCTLLAASTFLTLCRYDCT
jgi:hypothetical protein